MSANTNNALHGNGAMSPMKTRSAQFTLEEARRALVYLARVLNDATEAYRNAQHARTALAECRDARQRRLMCLQRDAAIARMNRTIDECHAVGVAMLDIPRGALALSARHNGAPVSLVWRCGDPIADAWAELDAQPAVLCRSF